MLADYVQKNYTASKAQCHDLMKTLQGQHLDPIIDTLSAQTDFEDIRKTIKTVRNEYNQRACGPAKNDVLAAFMEVHCARLCINVVYSRVVNHSCCCMQEICYNLLCVHTSNLVHLQELQQQYERLVGQLQKLKNYDAHAAKQMEYARKQSLEAERKEVGCMVYILQHTYAENA